VDSLLFLSFGWWFLFIAIRRETAIKVII